MCVCKSLKGRFLEFFLKHKRHIKSYWLMVGGGYLNEKLRLKLRLKLNKNLK